MTEEPERAAAGRASARGEKDKRERDLNFSDGTLDTKIARRTLLALAQSNGGRSSAGAALKRNPAITCLGELDAGATQMKD